MANERIMDAFAGCLLAIALSSFVLAAVVYFDSKDASHEQMIQTCLGGENG